MDAKNDDSAGSDSLDKSLQKKCVVDDVGQGEGPTANAALAQGINDNRNDRQKSDTETTDNLPANSINIQNKTEKSAGDGICDGIALENNYRIVDGDIDGLDIANNDTNATTAQMTATYESANANEDDTNINNNTEDGNLCTRINDSTTISNILINDAAEAPSENSINSNCSSNGGSSNNSNAFETKVKQISKNLKETTLAECANKKATAEDTNSTSSASSASSTSSTPECEQAAAVDAATAALYSLGPSTSAAAAAAAAASSSGAGTVAQDEHDNRSKKVRFHPDVKENDGGNRVIPKKKKKLKTTQGGGASTSCGGSAGGGGDEASGSSQRGTSTEDDMELDEEEDEDEGIFSIAKTIEDAQDYLKEHPLTFAGSFDKSNVTTQSGLLEEEDLPQLLPETEADDEEEVHCEVLPENGVACILGKQIKCGKVEFLLRYVDRPGLFWETEEFISQRCPNLLNQYEQCRERRQARLMSFVAKRQNLRQRYTDF